MLSYSTSRNKVQAIRQMVQTLCIFYFEDVTSRELDVLCEMIHNGVSGTEVRDSFIVNYRSTTGSFFQAKDRLTKKGILIAKPFKTGKELHPYFLDVKRLIDGNLSPHTFQIKVGDVPLMTLTDRFLVIQYDAGE